MMPGISLALIGYPGPMELAIIAFIVLLIFGPGKLPQVGKALGDGLRSFKKATSGEEIDVTPQEPAQSKQLDPGAPNEMASTGTTAGTQAKV